MLTLLLGAGLLANGQAQAQPGAAVIYVPDDYSTIQEAVNAASPGDTIIVRDGNYAENIAVTTDHLTIRSQNGAASTIVEAASPDASVFDVMADYVSLTGFTVTGAAGDYQAGIFLNQSSYCTLSDNTALDSYEGICLEESHHNTLTNNTAKWNSLDGILVLHSGNNTLTGNTANENDYFGIRLYFSSPNTLRNNSMANNLCNFYSWSQSYSELRQDVDTSNTVDGKPVYLLLDRSDAVIDSSANAGYVAIINSTNMTVKDLTITHSGHGVLFAFTDNSRIENVTGCHNKHSFLLYHSHNNMVVNNVGASNIYDGFRIWHSSNNTFLNDTSNSNMDGIRLYNSSNSTLTNCTSNSNRYGIFVDNSSNNILTHNSVAANYFGIVLRSSEDNVFYLNSLVNNTQNVFSKGSSNTCQSPKKLIYAYNGSIYTGYLGNYWSDFRANCPDAREIDSTGVWDTPYAFNAVDDHYPLVGMVEGVAGVAPPGVRELWALVVALTIIAVSACFLWGRKTQKEG